MFLELTLQDLPKPRFSSNLFDGPLKTLEDISERNRERSWGGPDPKAFRNRKEELIHRLKQRRSSGESFQQATDVLGRERLLLSIYWEHLHFEDAQSWLPPFDNRIALSILGNNGREWCSSRRRQVTMLFFTHFDRLDALSFVCERLLEAYDSTDFGLADRPRTWQENRGVIFHPSGPKLIAEKLQPGETLMQLLARFALPEKGRFSERLRHLVLLNQLQVVPYGKVSPNVFQEIEDQKEARVGLNQLLGAAALEIMVKRVATEGRGKWKGQWPHWITRFGCDPRYGRASGESAKWWGWATDRELRLARQALTDITLKFFIDFLEKSLKGTAKEAQFSLRARFLRALFDTGKIHDARLVLNQTDYDLLPTEYRDPWNVARLLETTSLTSIICLRCADDIHIIEGTHNFALRMFRGSFPIKDFWEHPKRSYVDRDLRINRAYCPVFIVHSASGAWVDTFFYNLRSIFHVEWYDVRQRLS